MKVLFIYPHMQHHMAAYNKGLWMLEVARQYPECKLAGHGFPDYKVGESLKDKINRLYGNDDPDWVVGGFVKASRINRNYKLTRWLEDMHVNTGIFAEVSNKGLDALIMRCLHTSFMFPTVDDFRAVWSIPREKWLESGHCVKVEKDFITKDLEIPVLFLPISVSASVFKPVDESEKKYDVTIIGSVGKFYPLRLAIWKDLPQLAKMKNWNALMKGAPNVSPYRADYRKIHNDPELRKKWLVREDYAKAVAESKIFIFGGSMFRYPLTKYLEGLMSGALVMADLPFHAEELHFKPDWNMVEINAENWKEKLTYYLEDDQLRETIARRGYETAMKYHTHKVRAKEFIDLLASVK